MTEREWDERQARLAKLNSPDTPWDQRLMLIEEIKPELGGLREWPAMERDWKYAGKEWQIPIPSEDLKRLDSLEGRAYSDARAMIVRAWLESHPGLQARILADTSSLHFVVVWAACQVWTKDEEYARWLMSKIVAGVLKDVDPPSTGIYQADQDQDPKGVLRQEAYQGLLKIITR